MSSKNKGVIWFRIDVEGNICEITNFSTKEEQMTEGKVKEVKKEKSGNGNRRAWISSFRIFGKAERDFLRSLARDCGLKLNNRGVFSEDTTKEQIEEFLWELRQQYSDVVDVQMFPLDVKRRL